MENENLNNTPEIEEVIDETQEITADTPAVITEPEPINEDKENPNNIEGTKKDDDKTANLLCIISLVCMFVLPGIATGISYVFTQIGNYTSFSNVLPFGSQVGYSLDSLSTIAAWVLMIIVRVKYRDNTFGKVLMWIYIVLAILALIVFAIFIFACVMLIKSCQGM